MVSVPTTASDIVGVYGASLQSSLEKAPFHSYAAHGWTVVAEFLRPIGPFSARQPSYEAAALPS